MAWCTLIVSASGRIGDLFCQVTSTISKGMAALSFDDEYLQQRAATNRHEVKHVGDGHVVAGP